ncbi:MAG: sortase [Anaerolineales bacterium]|nr:sortase [Anaerolineales bacterium]
MQKPRRRFPHVVFALAFVLAVLPGQAAAAPGPRCFVDASVGVAGDGSDWTNAYQDLQNALADPNCTEIWVAQGTYRPDGAAPDDRDLSFDLKNGVEIYGGFAGTETLLSERDWTANETILSGEIGLAGNVDNSYHVVVAGSTDSTAVLDGFTIRDGNANVVAFPRSVGGGMYIDGGSPTLSNLVFTANAAGSGGGGMYIDGGSPTMIRVAFIGNAASSGGGLSGTNSSFKLTEGVFRGNTAVNLGGGARLGGGSPQLTQVLFESNTAPNNPGGGIYIAASAALTNVTFYNNASGVGGGGVAVASGTGTYNHLTFGHNSPNAMRFEGGTSTIRNSIVWNHTAAAIDNSTLGTTFQDSILEDLCPVAATCTNVIDSDPLLGPLQDNGGFSHTMALDPLSPAIDAANSGTCAAVDQRGVPRPQLAGCDMGAYEEYPGEFSASSAPGSTLAFIAPTGSSDQLAIDVSNTGGPGSLLDVSEVSISAGYTVLAGLPIDNLATTDAAVLVAVRCDSAPTAPGTLMLSTNDPLLPAVTYNLTCTALEAVFNGSPTAPGPLAFVGPAGSSPQLSILVDNGGIAGSELDVSLLSISAGYSIVSGLPINDLGSAAPAETILVQCDNLPQPPGTLELITNDPLLSTVIYDLTCIMPPAPLPGPGAASKEIAHSGVTTLQFGRIWVSVPASAIPPGQSDCRITIRVAGDSGEYGFSLDDTVWDVKIVCDSGELNLFFDALTICIRPADGLLGDKNVYHRHAGQGFQAISGGTGPAGYVCGQTRLLSLFTLGQLSLPATGFAPGVVTDLGTLSLAYAASDLTLSIPKLGVELDILGVPQGPSGWDVTWLGNSQAGYLYGTTFPTWKGNSVLTAHVWNADNTPGPFHALRSLQHGDRFTISAYGYTYTYEVRSNHLVSESNLNILATSSHYSQITLLTCETYSESAGGYLYRRAVQAVLVAVSN